MTPAPPVIRAVLDRSAIESYARGHIHVGEVITEIASANGSYVGIPAAALTEAYARHQGDDVAVARLGVLGTLSGATVLALDDQNSGHVGALVPFTHGDLARAHAVWVSLSHDAFYFTADFLETAPLIPGHTIVRIPNEDA